jgi:hypothetical protein
MKRMNRKTVLLIASGLVLTVTGFGFGQSYQSKANPVLPAEMLGPQLIVWSQLQEPRPVPAPLPPPDRTVPPNQQNPNAPATAQDQSPAQPQEPAAQTFTGTILRTGSTYVLKAQGGITYQLDNQDDARQYDGKQVKVVANLDAKGALLHVVSIELMS